MYTTYFFFKYEEKYTEKENKTRIYTLGSYNKSKQIKIHFLQLYIYWQDKVK